MMAYRGLKAVLALTFAAGLAVGVYVSTVDVFSIPAAYAAPAAHAAPGSGPAGEVPDRYVYYPGTEALAKGEVRVIACGTSPNHGREIPITPRRQLGVSHQLFRHVVE